MRKYIATAVLAAAMTAVPLAGLAATRQAPAAAKKEATGTTKAAPTHATRGVVKSVDDSTLVITHGKKSEEMSFTLNGSTHKEGAVAVGVPVSVRYTESGKTHVATAVTVEQPSGKAATKK